MSVPLSTSSASVVSEYAATQTILGRTMQLDANGHLNPVFSAVINYARTDYVVDANGNKLNVIQRNPPTPPAPGQPWTPDPYTGSVNLTQAQMATLEALVPTTGLLAAIAAQEDSFIQADLVTRGLIAAPATS